MNEKNSEIIWLGGRKGLRPVKKWGMVVALVSPDGVAPSRMVGVSASVNLPLHHKVQKFSSGTGSSRWSRKKGRKTVVVVWLPKNQVKCPIFLRQCITDVNVFQYSTQIL